MRFLAGDHVAVCPPLIITPLEIEAPFDRLTRAPDRTRDRTEGLTAVG